MEGYRQRWQASQSSQPPPMGKPLMTRQEHIVIRKQKMAQTLKEKRARKKLALTAERDHREIQSLVRRGTEAAIKRMFDIIMSPAATDANAIQAAALLLERGYGKSTQTNVNAHIDANGKPSEVSADELDTRIATVLRRVEDIAGRKAEPLTSETGPTDLHKLN